jgi:hypothetical protein
MRVILLLGALTFLDTADVIRRPMVVHSFPAAGGETLVWEFRFNWTRSGSETAYALYMQLGDGARMSAASADTGAAVNLVWTRIGAAARLGCAHGRTRRPTPSKPTATGTASSSCGYRA